MDILDRLEPIIGNTPLKEIHNLNIPNNNRIFVKEEFRNPTGSHYDRIYIELFKSLERSRIIVRRKSELIELSSGNAGISFSWFCKMLGYPCKVILPKSINTKSCKEIIENGAQLIVSKNENYLHGAQRTLKELLIKNRDLICVNHSRNDSSLIGSQKIGIEIKEYFDNKNLQLDFFIPACGNGTSIIGPGGILKTNYPNLSIIAYEDKNAPVGFREKYPNKFIEVFGNEFKYNDHHLFGTGAWGIYFPFIMDNKYEFKKLVDDIVLLDDYEWLKVNDILRELGYNVGHTSIASFYVAMKLANKVNSKNIVIIFYDCRSKYFSEMTN